MNIFLENAQRIFDVARADSGAESAEFALLVLPDGGLHVIMESQVSLEAAAASAGARAAYLVSRSRDGVRVTGRGFGQQCVLECAQAAERGAKQMRNASPAAARSVSVVREFLQSHPGFPRREPAVSPRRPINSPGYSNTLCGISRMSVRK